jgi:hypothetical protein
VGLAPVRVFAVVVHRVRPGMSISAGQSSKARMRLRDPGRFSANLPCSSTLPRGANHRT